MYGLGSPVKLIREVVSELHRQHPALDAVILDGDFNDHGIALRDYDAEEVGPAWEKMKMIMGESFRILRQTLGHDVALLPTIGNNDVTVHDKAPCRMY